MSDSLSLVTIARFSNPTVAALARNDLEAEGIRAFLLDEGIVSTVWHLTTAVGGVRLQVPAADAGRALAILEQSATQAPEARTAAVEAYAAESAIGGSAKTEVEEDEAEPALTTREENAERAFRGAGVGLVLWPLQIYVFWLLLKVTVSEERLSGRARHRAFLATAINLPFMIVFLWLLRTALYA